MAGKITSLGLGSSVLNADVIDKLKKADEDNLIKPVDKKLELNLEKQKQLVEIFTALSTLKGHTKRLSDYSTFLNRNVNVSGDSIKATAAAGIPIQDIGIEVKRLAKSDINEVGTKFSSRDDAFSNEDTTLNIYSNGTNYDIQIKAGMTLGEVSQAITDSTNAKIIGVIMKTGGQKPYQLMINGKETGEDNRIYFGTVLKSERVSDFPFKLNGEKDFYVEIKGSNGQLQKISLDIDVTDSVSDAPEFIREKLRDALLTNEFTKELLENGDINIGLGDGGKSLIINDKRGYKVAVGGENIGKLGFSQKESQTKDLYDGTNAVAEGLLSGSFKVNGTEIKLEEITKKENTAKENAEAIVEALNKIEGIMAATKDDKITLNSHSTTIDVTGEDSVLNSAGLKAGKYTDFAVLQKNVLKAKNIQTASDSEMSYNGATIKRPSNTVDDIISGLTINLQKVSEEGKSDTISITPSTDEILKEVQEFVKVYNDTVPKLDAVTKFDPDTKRGGVFNTESIIRNIRPNLNQAITQRITNGLDVRSLMDYGISLNDKSVMFLDAGKLASAISADPEKAKQVFYGGEIKDSSGKLNQYDGVFTKVNKVLADLVEGGNAKLKTFEQTLERELKNYNSEKEKAKKMLDARYDTMAQRFAAFDEQIAKANNSFNAVQMMIDQAAANDKKK
ncbi:flagellar filament capping protein FliD [Helicobacter muridarum]|uniref:Flagellar hook-associated protein 2 n=1 Tax=Helicobacter muridarum TaxID=216 RepID=A0A099U239_9HELI|nr:flagellar filament capping protein FliD [Helicobacter muridarum]TLE01374.1 flagellar filament capping protein FliD [Helicobacter muridarum]STQ85300.1 flagellar hook-associated protein [Helicobacter muridarum]